MTTNSKGYHSTSDEKVFIKNIGQHHVEKNKLSRAAMLENYIEAMPKRINWGDINPVEVLEFAQQELLSCNLIEAAIVSAQLAASAMSTVNLSSSI